MSAHTLPLWGALGLPLLIGASAAGAAYAAVRSQRRQRLVIRYIERLDAPLRRTLMPARGRFICSLQLTLSLLAFACSAALREPLLLLIVAPIMFAPAAAIRYLRKKRTRRIDEKLDGFALALANATRATPSVGRALKLIQTSVATPLDEELAQVLREMQVGSSLDHALLNFSWRVQSHALDALLSSVLIARRIGGNLPDVLETTASTLREMARLEAVLRSKTADARTQMWALACVPPVIVLAFSAMTPGYFMPLVESPMGPLLIVIAATAWLAASVLARKILAVQL